MKINNIKKNLILLLLIIGSQAFGQDWYEKSIEENTNFFEVEKLGDAYFKVNGTGPGSGYKLFLRWKYFAQRNMDKDGNVLSQKDIVNNKRKFDSKYAQHRSATFSGNWSELGPFSWQTTTNWNPGLGRIISLAVEAKYQQVLYAGSPGGGVWRTRNAGAKWEPVGDHLSSLTVWGIGIDPFDSTLFIIQTQQIRS